MKEKKDKKEKQKKKFMTPQKYTVITIVFVGIIVGIGIYSNIANWSGQKGVKVETSQNYETTISEENNEKVIGKPSKFNNTFVVDIFNNQIWLNSIVLFTALLLCFVGLPILSYLIGKKLKYKSPPIQLLYLIFSSLINFIFYFWLPIAFIMTFINYVSYKRGLNSIERKKEKKDEFSDKK